MMKKIIKKWGVALTLAVTSLNAFAYDETDRQELESIINIYKQGIDNGDFEPMADSMTPRLFEFMAEQMEMSVEESKALMVTMMASLVGSIASDGEEEVTMSYDVDLEKAEAYESTTGREYVIFPTYFSMITDQMAYQSDGHAIAIEDEGNWYINRLANQQNIALTQILYPDIKQLDVPNATMEITPLKRSNEL